MTKNQFLEQLRITINIGSSLKNPGGGDSTIASIGEDKLSYIRGSSRIYLPHTAIIDVLDKFSGRAITTNELKKYNPVVFDTKNGGHNCNCTLMFCILEMMGLT